MDFALSEEQRMFRDMFRNFATKEIAPRAEEMDHAETMPKDLLRKAADQGFLGATVPEDYAGAALDNLSYILLLENLSTACASLAVTVATHVSLVATSILESGTDAQKEEWLPAMAAGEAIGAFALSEPDAGSDMLALETRAVPDGDEVVLDGVKTWVANGELAGLFLVFAHGPQGIDAYLVPRDAPGLTVGYREPTLGLRSVYFNTVYLEGCRVPQANRLGSPGEGAAIAQRDEPDGRRAGRRRAGAWPNPRWTLQPSTPPSGSSSASPSARSRPSRTTSPTPMPRRKRCATWSIGLPG